MAKQNWISLKEAAEVANVSRQTIWRNCGNDGYEKLFVTATQVGTTWMVDRDEIVRYGEYVHSSEFDDENESDEVE